MPHNMNVIPAELFIDLRRFRNVCALAAGHAHTRCRTRSGLSLSRASPVSVESFQCQCEERVLHVQKLKSAGCFKVLLCVLAHLGACVSDGAAARSFQILPEALHQRAVIRPESSEGLSRSARLLRLNQD